jgi:hypothetical protein
LVNSDQELRRAEINTGTCQGGLEPPAGIEPATC